MVEEIRVIVCIADVITLCVLWWVLVKMFVIMKSIDEPSEISIKVLEQGKIPEFKTDGAVCADCYSRGEYIIKKGERGLVPLGFCMELPVDFEAVIRPRSGLSKQGIDVQIGTIDTDYRGEVMANVVNNTDADFLVTDGMRICQLAVREISNVKFVEVKEVTETNRGDKGFGHTGV